MIIRTRFDGQSIVLPKELVGHGPCDVDIVVSEVAPQDRVAGSIWDVVAKANGQRNGADVVRETSTQRDEWERA